MGVIYKITNLVNGKVYVGQTSSRPQKRWNEHCCAARKKFPKLAIHRAMAKYGFDNFAMEVIDSARLQDELNRKEQEWIVKLNSSTSGNGYNLTSGGEGCSAIDLETKKKMSEATRRRWQDPKMRQHYAENVWTPERRAENSRRMVAFYATPDGQDAKEAIRVKISKMRTCQACQARLNGSQWQKHPAKCPAASPRKIKRKTEASRMACGNAMRGTKRPLEEVARRAESIRKAWTPEKRAAFSIRMKDVVANRPKVHRQIPSEQRQIQSEKMKGRQVRLGIKNSPEANRNVAEAAVRGWIKRRARAASVLTGEE